MEEVEKSTVQTETAESKDNVPAENQTAETAPETQAEVKKENTAAKVAKKAAKKGVKLIKAVVYTILILLLLLIATVIGVYFMRDAIIATAIRKVGSAMLDTQVDVKEFKSKPFAGEVHVGDFTIANPEGFNSGNVIEVKKFDVKVDTASVFSDVIVIEYMELSGVNALLEYDVVNNKLNMHTLLNNVKRSMGKEPAPLIVINTPEWMKKDNLLNVFKSDPAEEKSSGSSGNAATAESKAEPAAETTAEAAPESAAAEEAAPEAQAAAKKKILIKKLVLKDIKFSFRSTLFNIEVPIYLLDMEFNDLGNVHNAGELTELILSQLLNNILLTLNNTLGIEVFQPISGEFSAQLESAVSDTQQAANEAIDKYSGKATEELDRLNKKISVKDPELQKTVDSLTEEGKNLIQDGGGKLKKRVDGLKNFLK